MTQTACAAAIAAAFLSMIAAPAVAQEPVPAPADAGQAPSAADCELHIWPTNNFIGFNSGLLSGFGVLGVLADMGAHDGRVRTVKDAMREYLGPEIQIEELSKLDVAKRLKLAGYRIVVEKPTRSNEEVKASPEIKAEVKAMNDRLKAKQRLSDSTQPCYAELVTTMVFYHKAMMYGSNLFTGWIFREFRGQPTATKTAVGAVKNPLEEFPPKTPDKIDVAKLELRDAYAKDFVEYVEKKAMP